MSNPSTESAVVVEREFPHPTEKVWRAITQPLLIEEWLMKNDFKPAVGHCFTLSFDWGTVECQVLEVNPMTTLSYTWVSGHLDTVVTWTLSPTSTGTHLRMEQVGFHADHPRYYIGAKAGWPKFLDALEQVLARANKGGRQ